jgi:ABC-type antimicrobial peptide transport system permease subunit
MVLVRSAVLVALGLVIGGGAAWFLSGAAETFLFRIQTSDWRVFATALGLIVLAALLASAIPARRAASVNPVEALRAD